MLDRYQVIIPVQTWIFVAIQNELYDRNPFFNLYMQNLILALSNCLTFQDELTICVLIVIKKKSILLKSTFQFIKENDWQSPRSVTLGHVLCCMHWYRSGTLAFSVLWKNQFLLSKISLGSRDSQSMCKISFLCRDAVLKKYKDNGNCFKWWYKFLILITAEFLCLFFLF